MMVDPKVDPLTWKENIMNDDTRKNIKVEERDLDAIRSWMETQGINSYIDFMHLVAENLNKLAKKDSEPDEKIKQEEEE